VLLFYFDEINFGTIGSDPPPGGEQGRLMGVKIKPTVGICEMMG
jgi:hypothetical protein